MSPKDGPPTGAQGNQPGQISEAKRNQLHQAALAARKQDKEQHEARLQAEFKGFDQLNGRYRAQVEAAARRAGIDLQQIQAELKHLLEQPSEEPDESAIEARVAPFRAKYDPIIQRVLAEAKIDPTTIGNEAMKQVQLPPQARPLSPGRGKGHGAGQQGQTGTTDADTGQLGWVSE